MHLSMKLGFDRLNVLYSNNNKSKWLCNWNINHNFLQYTKVSVLKVYVLWCTYEIPRTIYEHVFIKSCQISFITLLIKFTLQFYNIIISNHCDSSLICDYLLISFIKMWNYYRPPEGGRLYDMKVVSGYAFLRTYYV